MSLNKNVSVCDFVSDLYTLTEVNFKEISIGRMDCILKMF